MDWPAGQALELIGRLSKAESLVFLGPDADRIRALTDLCDKRIGIGPMGSGTGCCALLVGFLCGSGYVTIGLGQRLVNDFRAKLHAHL
jgi:hypothetical protein